MMTQALILKTPSPPQPSPPKNADWGLLGWIILAMASGGGLATVIGKTVDGLFDFLKTDKQEKDNIKNTFLRVAEVFDLLTDLKRETKSSRVLVCKASNGGEIPKVTSALYISIIFELHDEDLDANKKFWNHRLVEKEIIDILSHLFTTKQTVLNPEKVAETTAGAFWGRDGVHRAVVTSIGYNEKEFFYLITDYRDKDDYELNGKDYESKARDYASVIANIFKVHPKDKS